MGHTAHVGRPSTGTTVVFAVPAMHSQAVWSAEAVEFIRQVRHDEPDVAATVLAVHCVHSVANSLDEVPAAQGRHSVLPVVFLYVPTLAKEMMKTHRIPTAATKCLELCIFK